MNWWHNPWTTCYGGWPGAMAQGNRFWRLHPPTTAATKLLWSLSPEEDVSRQPVADAFSAEFSDCDHQLARVEAVLFLARQPMSARKIAQIAGLDSGSQVRALLRRLNKLYDEKRMAFRAIEVAGGFQLRTRACFEPWIARLVKDPHQTRLSPPALETLTVIAYRQPILRAEIESIRGVQCGEVIRQLLERGLIRVVGRSEELGRPYLYGTTARFLEMFGLRGLDDLPHPEYRIPSVALRRPVAEASNGG